MIAPAAGGPAPSPPVSNAAVTRVAEAGADPAVAVAGLGGPAGNGAAQRMVAPGRIGDGHEMHELNALRRLFDANDGYMRADRLYRAIAPGFTGNPHGQAWDVADKLVKGMRGG